jgi:polyhydroxybutyrate depolymerase
MTRIDPLRLRLVAVCLSALAAAACTQEPSTINVPTTQGQAFFRSVDSGGRTRTYQVFVPGTVRSEVPAPVMISLHASPGSSSDMRGISGFDQVARSLQTIMVYPDATSDWAEGCDCTQADAAGVDDVQFIRDLIDDLDTSFRVNRDRVYAAGFSDGGFFAQRLACDMEGDIAAIAVVAATMSGPLAATCDPPVPVSFLMIHGTADPRVPAAGSGGTRASLGARETVDFWLEHNGCGTEPTVTSVQDVENDGTSVNVEQYQSCDGGTEVEFYEVVDGGHTWPNPILAFPPESGLKTLDIDAAAAIGVFFLRHG